MDSTEFKSFRPGLHPRQHRQAFPAPGRLPPGRPVGRLHGFCRPDARLHDRDGGAAVCAGRLHLDRGGDAGQDEQSGKGVLR